MHRRFLTGSLLFAALLAPSASSFAAKTANSLDQVPALLKTPEAKSTFDQQIVGKQEPDLLGRKLPPGLWSQQIAQLLAPDESSVAVVGAKPFPGQADAFVAVVCTQDDCATSGDNAPGRVYVGLIAAKDGAAPRLLAKPAKVEGAVAWQNTGLPDAPDALDDAKDGELRPDSYDRFDLANYQIAPGQRAFGLRGVWENGYSGGMAEYSALYLFAVIDGAVRQVFAAPMSSFKNLAGDWNKDGTRQHEITEGANILIVTAHSTNGHFDLLLKARTGKKQQVYRWSVANLRYEPAK